ncbi:hypothetical protein DFA_02668 [Cavenderia fasciculata]|uniref:Uncharacterized protein n=1 Tax=Cavenderia fasciculata TaxID=261658 RepID=F4Q014_CACFS|nr:uncharacterized protein DFA_02668 [Cavenderia fasciculata]EGG18928.1 hypothetical protein DFA_02668 [Cavenderia fasciculata]|eukprot:XP_004357390.1 hypothetical protein DFA_02668 [Cavenderia fasciculata]
MYKYEHWRLRYTSSSNLINKTIIIDIYIFKDVQNHYRITPGNWIWHQENQPCGSATIVNVTTTDNQFTSFGNTPSYTFLVNCTINPADNTFTGLGTLYYPGTYTIFGYTNVKGQLINPFSLVAVYARNSNPYFPGATQYYGFSHCYSNSESYHPITSNFEASEKGLDVIGRPL